MEVWFFVMGAMLFGILSEGPSMREARPRARDVGVTVGVLPPGRWNAITDVAGGSRRPCHAHSR
jgi:hypothetical protein